MFENGKTILHNSQLHALVWKISKETLKVKQKRNW